MIDINIRLVLVVVTGLILLFIRLERELTPSKIALSKKLLAQQQNNPTLILYLRDFAVDGIKSTTVNVGYHKSTFLDTNFETELSIVASQVGHFIALGVNSETGDIGAYRYVVEDEQWRDRIKELMGKSSMILIRPSLSVGLIWELEQIVKDDYLYKTVICYHKRQDGRKNYKLFRDVIQHFIKLPTNLFASRFMCFDENKKVKGYLSLEETPIFLDLLNREKLRLSSENLSGDKEQGISVGELMFLMAILLFVFGLVIYLKVYGW